METCGPYQCLRLIYKGGDSKIKLAKNSTQGNLAVLKIIPDLGNSNPDNLNRTHHEISILERLSHDNIVKLVDSCVDATHTLKNGSTRKVFYIAYELVHRDDLLNLVFYTGTFSETTARYYFKQLIDALEHMHVQGISHLDLNLSNLLLNHNYKLKILGFKNATDQNEVVGVKGTDHYLAPEVLKFTAYKGTPADIFSAGVILFTIVTNCRPFKEADDVDLTYEHMVNGDRDKFWDKCYENIANELRENSLKKEEDKTTEIPTLSDNLKDLLSGMFAYDPEERLTLEQIKQHPWFAESVSSDDEIIDELDQRHLQLLQILANKKTTVPTYDSNESTRTEGEEESKDAREADKYISDYKRGTEFFSSSPLSDLFQHAVTYASNNAQNFDIDEDEYCISMDVISDQKQVSFHLNILAGKEDKNCVDVIHQKGDHHEFLKVFDNIINFFSSNEDDY